jgi:hypothetical protein
MICVFVGGRKHYKACKLPSYNLGEVTSHAYHALSYPLIKFNRLVHHNYILDSKIVRKI